MRLAHLRLVQFRNHRRTDVAPGPGVTLFVGDNAQGKSALLEAVQVTVTGRSFRARQDLEMIAFGAEWARVRAAVERRDRGEEIDIVLRREDGGGLPRVVREMRVNGVPVRRGELFGHLRCVLAAPDDGEVVTGPPHRRRQLLDQLLAQISPAYYYIAQRYLRVLAQRNRLLRLRGPGLEAWDEQLATLGAGLTVRRRDLVDRLARIAAPVYSALCQGREQLVLEYRPSLRGEAEAAMVDWTRQELLRRRAEEAAGGATLVGPHRDDLVLRLDGRDLRAYGSRGQQLTAMLAVRLAERAVLLEETGEEPVLLLDDVLLTLDEARQTYLLENVGGAQTLITATTVPPVSLPPGTLVYRIRAGAVEGQHAHPA